jgi:tetratricopeptide (TPR) repeat protein
MVPERGSFFGGPVGIVQDLATVSDWSVSATTPDSRKRRRARRLFVFFAAAVLVGGVDSRLAAAEAPHEAHADALDEARALLAAGQLAEATSKAREETVASPGRGAAYLVLGLALFRSGHYDQALKAFASAKSAERPAAPGPTAFNEGAALFKLGRYKEARAAFAAAAKGAPELAFLANVNAAEAALADDDVPLAQYHTGVAAPLAGTAERKQLLDDLLAKIRDRTSSSTAKQREARRDEARAALANDQPARAAALYQELLSDRSEPPLSSVERNLFEHGLGLALLRQDRHPEAAQHFAVAAAIDANDGDSLFMQGLASYRAGAWRNARVLFAEALTRPLDAETTASAHSYLDRLSFGARRGGEGASLGFSAGGGYDSNVVQGSDARPQSMLADQVGSAGDIFLSGAGDVGYQWLLGQTGFFAADYGVDQLAYPDRDHDAYSLQDHSLRLRGEWSPTPDFHAAMLGSENLQFAGLAGFRLFQSVVTAEPSLAFDELPFTSTNVRLRAQQKSALDATYSYYSGSRIDVQLAQRVRWRGLRGELALRHRRERIGTRNEVLLETGTSQTFKFRKRKPTDPPDVATYNYLAPYSYDANAALMTLELARGFLRFEADASAEIQDYLGDDTVYFDVPTMNINRLYQSQHRRDLHLATSLSAAASITEHLDVLIRYEFTDNRSTLILDVDNRNYLRHVIALSIEADY